MLLQEMLTVYSEKPTERVSTLQKSTLLIIEQVVHVVTTVLQMVKEFCNKTYVKLYSNTKNECHIYRYL
jgi:hypothetical protein